MENLYLIVISTLAGICASMGLGGGMALIVYLSLFTTLTQSEISGVNLLFFLPISALSLVIHLKNKLVDKKALIICSLSGALFALVFSVFAQWLNPALLRKAFALLIIAAGVKELFFKKKKPPEDRRFYY